MDARGIVLGAMPFQWLRLGRRRSGAQGVAADRLIRWSEVAAAYLPDAARAWSLSWSWVMGVLLCVWRDSGDSLARPMIARVRRRDGTHALHIMRGVRYDAWSMAEAVHRFAPHVAVTVG